MKNLFFLFLTTLSGCLGHAQNTPISSTKTSSGAEVATYAMPAGKKAVLKLPYARTITVKAWDRAELQLNSIVKATRAEDKQVHTIEVNDGQEELNIKTDFKKEYLNQNWNRDRSFWCNNCDSLLDAGVSSTCYCLRIDYEIMMPTGSSLSLESISGNIEIRGLIGSIRAKTISGFVDIDRPLSTTADIDFRSVTGEIYTDFDIKLNQNSTAYSKKVAASINGGGNSVRAESVSGDIYFRKRGK